MWKSLLNIKWRDDPDRDDLRSKVPPQCPKPGQPVQAMPHAAKMLVFERTSGPDLQPATSFIKRYSDALRASLSPLTWLSIADRSDRHSPSARRNSTASGIESGIFLLAPSCLGSFLGPSQPMT